MSVPGVCTSIVGTTNPDRRRQNARLLEPRVLSAQEYRALRSRWAGTAGPDWVELS